MSLQGNGCPWNYLIYRNNFRDSHAFGSDDYHFIMDYRYCIFRYCWIKTLEEISIAFFWAYQFMDI